jgi:hypothetical protein
MRKTFILLAIMLSFILLCSCTKQEGELAKMEFPKSSDGKYMTIVWNGKTYVPYTTISKSEMGKKIGYYIDEYTPTSAGKANTIYVYEYKGYSSSEWLVDYVDSFMNTPSLWREVKVTKIPEGLHSDYDWNNNTSR